MRPTVILSYFILSAICSAGAEPVRIGVSLLPLESLIREIGGEFVEVRALQGEGDSCSVFEPRPSAIAWLSQAELFFRTGAAFEGAILPKIQSQYPDMKIIDLQLIAGDHASEPGHADHGHDHMHEHHCADCSLLEDIHVWLDPVRLMALSSYVADQLGDHLPSRRLTFKQRSNALNEALMLAHKQLQEQLKGYRGFSFYIYHPALGYFADRYGLQQIAIASTGQGPTSRQLHSLIVQAREQQVKAILVQPQESRRQAEIIASAIGAEVVEINPMSMDLVSNIVETGNVLADTFKRD